MVISFTIDVSVAKKRHRLSSTVQLTLYSIVIGILVESGQQETKISAEFTGLKGRERHCWFWHTEWIIIHGLQQDGQ